MANKTMHHAVIGSDTYEIVDEQARTTDATLSVSGKAADAKATGDLLFVTDMDDEGVRYKVIYKIVNHRLTATYTSI